MLTITGKVIKKQILKKPVKVKLLVEDETGKIHKLQVRPKHILKLIVIDTGCNVQINCTNEMNNLIIKDIIAI